jgi:hypothetical protein
MNKGKRLLAMAVILSLSIFGSSTGKAQSETCTLELGGSGHCVNLVQNGKIIGFQCDDGSGQIPCNY